MTNLHPHTTYDFEDFHLDAVHLLLYRNKQQIALAPKVIETLLALVHRRGEVLSKDELMEIVWADSTVEEGNLSQNLYLLRKVLGKTADGKPFIETLHRRGYRFNGEVACVEPDSTAPSHQPDGRVEHPTNGSASADRRRIDDNITERFRTPSSQTASEKPALRNRMELESNGSHTRVTLEESGGRKAVAFGRKRKLAVGLICVMVASGIIAWGYFVRRPSNAETIESIAVLPFKPLSVENRDEVLELGIADALISKLSGNGRIAVRPLSAVRRYNVVEQDPLAAGRELKVQSVLDGTIQISNGQIKVSPRLISVGDGRQLWASTFVEDFTDIFAVQDSIVERVAATLQAKLDSKKPATKNVEAYQLYMKGRYHSAKLVQPDTLKAIGYFQQAIEVDPNYALAYVALANTYRRLSITSDIPSAQAMPKAKAAALKAIEIAPDLGEAYTALGLIDFWYDWDWRTAEKHFLRASELDPNNAEAHHAYAHFLSNIGQHEKALAEAKRSRELDPVSMTNNALDGQFLFFAGKTDEALDELGKAIDLDQTFWLTYLIISRVYEENGLHSEAIRAASKAKELSPSASESSALIAYSLARSGESEKARIILKELVNLSDEKYVPPYNFALIYNALGNSEKALNYLEKGFNEKDVRMAFLKVEPKWNNLRNEARFIALMQRMNF